MMNGADVAPGDTFDEDVEDLAAFDERADEPTMSLDELLAELFGPPTD